MDNPSSNIVNIEYKDFIWIETVDSSKNTTKIYFSFSDIDEIVKVVNNKDLHNELFQKELKEK